MIREPSESVVERAARRLEAALVRLEQAAASGSISAAGAESADRAHAETASKLEATRARERELEAAAAAASDALGRAIDEIRTALGAPVESAGE